MVTESGIQKIPFTELPAELGEKYGYDASKAAVYSAAVAKAQGENYERAQQILREQAAIAARAVLENEQKRKPK